MSAARKLHPWPLLVAWLAVLTACDRGEPPTDPALTMSAARSVAGLGGTLPLLGPEERRMFERGSMVFQTVFTPETGLGPLFNDVSCSSCHGMPVAGGVGAFVDIHATAFVNGVCEEHEEINGGSVIQQKTTPLLQAAGMMQERIATELEGLALGRRTTPDLFGFGLLEAVPERVILSLADPDDRNGDGISGRPNITDDGHLGRFGHKAALPDLVDFTVDAFIYEQGITNPPDEVDEQTNFGHALPEGMDPAPDPELSAEDVQATVTFVRFLAPPPPLPFSPEALRGRRLFSEIGCASCHVPALRTGPNPVKALSHKVVFAYTDMLLHDMGPELADICNNGALPSEFRTEPLMGLRLSTTFLHDGRAQSIEEAILLHGGEAQRARDRFAELSERERSMLMAFLKSL